MKHTPPTSRGHVSSVNPAIRPALRFGLTAAAVVTIAAGSVFATDIQGTMSNFDVFNETGGPVYGAEIELEGVNPSEVTRTYPAHFNNMATTAYTSGSTYGTRLVFTGYTFNPPNTYIIPRVGQTTNGHYAVNLPGCEHFGFSVARQPTRTAFYWLDNSSHRVGAALSIPMPTWTYVPAVGGAPAVMQAVLAPPPPPPAVMYPDAVWVKTFVTELTTVPELEHLISYDPANIDPAHPSVAPQLPSEVEAEWELLPGDAPLVQPDFQMAEAGHSVVRRYEYYKYTGSYDEVHLPNYQYDGGPLPPDAPLGQFIAANMVAANLDCPATTITLQPVPAAACTTGTVSFHVTASSTEALTYQWRIGSVPLLNGPNGGGGPGAATISGATTATLTVSAAPGSPFDQGDIGSYDCVVTNHCNEVISSAAQLFVDPADVGSQGGVPGRDGIHDNNDFIVYIDSFFSMDPGADLGSQGGVLGSDGLFDNNDFVVFIDQFFAGC